MTLLAPGSAQLVYGNRRVGLVAFRTWLTLLTAGLVLVALSLVHHQLAFWLVSDTTVLALMRLLLLLVAVGWAALLVDAWRLGQPLSYGMVHRRVAVGVNGLLCFGVAGSLLFGAHLVGVQRDFMLALFGDGKVTGAHDGRFNVLLLGGDSGAGRWGLRPDSMTVASIDAETGRTVLIGLPRNMENFHFAQGSVMDEQFPDGFDADYLNGVSTWAQDHTDLFPHPESAGTDATVSAIEGITGLDINYWAMVNLEGFKDLVDAVGGVTLNVRQPIPVGGLGDDVTGYLEPGTRKLDGFETLWYARAREGSDDYSRMARQKCVMNAMLQQVSPQSALTNFESIAKASSAMVSTNIPTSEVDRFLDLGLKAKGEKISTLSLVPPMIDTADPDLKLVHRKVAQAVAASEGTPAPARAGTTTPSEQADAPDASDGSDGSDGSGQAGGSTQPESEPVTGGSVGSLSQGYAANQAEDLDSAC